VGCTYKKIRKVEFGAKTQFLYQELETQIEEKSKTIKGCHETVPDYVLPQKLPGV